MIRLLCAILKSDGGLTNLDLAGQLPVNILMSGPAGGVKGITSIIANATEHKNLITLDMGGTSTDVALITNCQPSLRRETVVGDLTVRSPSVDVRTIGAGGGSLAFFQPLTNTLRVGPESSGANPGPACYGRGGTQATVTDANLVLGYLPETLLGGDFKLDIEASKKAVSELATQMGKTLFEAAEAIIDLANEAIYGALRLVSVERGHNPADFALVAFGGAGAHVCERSWQATGSMAGHCACGAWYSLCSRRCYHEDEPRAVGVPNTIVIVHNNGNYS